MQTGQKAHLRSGSGAAGPSLRCPRPLSTSARPGHKSRLVARADRRDGDPDVEELKDKFFRQSEQQRSRSQPASSSEGQQQSEAGSLLDSVNPYQLGRQARQAVNELWGQLSAVAAPTKSFSFDDVLDIGLDADAPSSASRTRKRGLKRFSSPMVLTVSPL